jgi:hypothetical protein
VAAAGTRSSSPPLSIAVVSGRKAPRAGERQRLFFVVDRLCPQRGLPSSLILIRTLRQRIVADTLSRIARPAGRRRGY